MKISKIVLSLLAGPIICLLVPHAFSQTERLGIVKYTPPTGMTKTLKENVVAFSEIDVKTGKYCIITVYGATPGTGAAEADFRREWANLVVKNMTADEKNPKIEPKQKPLQS